MLLCFRGKGSFAFENSQKWAICPESLVKISIYDENGNFFKKEISLKSLECFFINSNELNTKSDFVWITCETDRPNLFQYTYQTNIEKYFSSGEHSFWFFPES